MIRKLFTQTLTYGASTIIARLINYLIVPLHTSVFNASSYGDVSFFYSYAVIFNAIYLYGMETAYFRMASFANAQRTSQTLLLISSFLFSLIGILITRGSTIWMYMLGILTFDTLAIIPFAALRQQNKAALFSGLKILNSAITVFLNIIFLIYQPLFIHSVPMIERVFLANLLASLLMLILLSPVWLKAGFGIDKKMAFQLLNYGWPLLLSGLFFAVNETSDRLMLMAWSKSDAARQVGIYSACYKLSIFISLGVQAYKFAAEPLFFGAKGSGNEKELYARSMTYFVGVCAVMMFFVSANLSILAHIFLRNSEYHSGIFIIPYLLLANTFLGMYYNFSVWYKLTDRTHFAATFGLIGAVTTVIINYILIPKWGYWGSTIATLACYGLMAFLCFVIGQIYYPVPYSFKILLYLFLGFFLSLIVVFTNLGILLNNFLLLCFILFFVLNEKLHLYIRK